MSNVLYTRIFTMQAGYQYDRKSAAKALKASLKNRRRDKVLYGAVIKQESVFSSTTIGQPPAPPGTPEATVGTTTSTQPPAPPGAPSVTSAPSVPQPALSQEATTSLRRPPNPLFAELLSAGPLRTGQASPPLPARSTPAITGPQGFTMDLGTPLSAKERLKRVDNTIKKAAVIQKSLAQLRAEQHPSPVDTREHNVVVDTPVETVAPPTQATIVPTAIPRATPIGVPSLRDLAIDAAYAKRMADFKREHSDMTNEDINRAIRASPPSLKELAAKALDITKIPSSRGPASSKPIIVESVPADETSFVSGERARIKSESARAAKSRYFETLKPEKPESSRAPTEIATSMAPSSGPSSPSSSSAHSPVPSEEAQSPIDLRDKNTSKGLSAQNKAAELFKLNQEARRRAGVERIIQNSETITAFIGMSGDAYPKVLVITNANGKFNFALGRGKEFEGANKHPGRTGVDVVNSLERAILAAKDTNRFKAVRKPGEKTGLGLAAEDPDKIGSTRVVYRSNKNPNSVARGQLYLMQPQLIRGHIRLYNKSGRPVVSRSNVSPAFQSIARDIVERNSFEADDYNNLDPKETIDANAFIQATMPIQPRNINRLANADTIWKMKKRYEVLVGEMAAGNDGKIVRDEMSEILKNLVRMHAMGESKGRDLIKALREY